MKVLILGASGYIGSRLADRLIATQGIEVIRASRGRRRSASSAPAQTIDTRDQATLLPALRQVDCVVNCVAGDFDSIASGARALCSAALSSSCRRIVHLSSMAVYGRAEGLIDEGAPQDPEAGWYARAKCEAEKYIGQFVRDGGEAVLLRPGCVYGPGCHLWVGRIARWLRARRIGDLGPAGDGWSNLVHVDDVCGAVLRALSLPASQCNGPAFNLAAPDSPRWNEYFLDLALAIGATPVRWVSERRLKLDMFALGPPLKLSERLLDRMKTRHTWLPEPLPPSVVRLWPQTIRLDVRAASIELATRWTTYADSVAQLSSWAAA